VGAVVIGRNEGARLVACLASVRAEVGTVVYVDSGSTDGSVERAKEAGAIALPLEKGPFSAARGRQEGLDVLMRESPGMEFVQFIDGDCLLQPGFVGQALGYLLANARTAAVTGRRREEGNSFYSRLIDIDWDIAPGAVRYVGGDSLWRISAVREAGGWAPELIAGEEPDLCFRLHDLGWAFHRLPVEMTLHDIRMRRFIQYWRRSVRAGHAYAEVAMRRRRGNGREWGRTVVSILAYGLVLPLGFVAAVIWFWPVAAVIALLYARLIASMVMRCRRKGRSLGLSIAYALYTTVCKSAGVIGVARYFIGRLTGSRSRIIEYHGKRAVPAAYAQPSSEATTRP
jgi:glycosyltransferase involved in cell wall biosynthesis